MAAITAAGMKKVKGNNNQCSYFMWHSLLQALMVFTVTNGFFLIIDSMKNVDDIIVTPNSETLDLQADPGSRQLAKSSRTNYKTSLVRVETKERPADFAGTPNLYELIGRPVMNNAQLTGKMMCDVRVPPKFVSKTYWYHKPNRTTAILYKDEQLYNIPRIVHQFWVEDIDPKKHPNLSRLQNSWKASGWDYRIYSNATAETYIAQNFPVEVLEAYHALVPSILKSHLFRYCVMFLEGGVWADVEVQLQSFLDHIVTPEISFMIARDLGGNGLSNSLMMVAPGHPIMAKAIEETVNMVRNRFTIVDITAKYCPDVRNGKLLRSNPDSFLSGAAMLGYVIRQLSGYPFHVPILPGPFSLKLLEMKEALPKDHEDFWRNTITTVFQNKTAFTRHGKTVIFRRMRGDMGATRFTDLEKNMIVASTGYTRAQEGTGWYYYNYGITQTEFIWGIKNIYKDMVSSDEEIRIEVMDSTSTSTTATTTTTTS